MKFRNYCIVVMGDTIGIQSEITKICEGDPNILDAKGILIATFTSVGEPNELTAWFTENNRNFLIFDLDKENSGFNFTKKKINDGLFGFLKNVNTAEMDDNFLKTISSSETKNFKAIVKGKNKLSQENIKKMSPSEKQDLLNELIDSGLENLTDNDKELLSLLAK